MVTFVLLVVAAGAVMLYKARAARRINQADLGWMSAQWLADQRASHLS